VYTEGKLRELFLALDASGDGYLSFNELLRGVNNMEVDWEALDVDRQTVLNRIWTKADKDGNDRVSFQEFWHLVSAERSPTELEIEKVYQIFVELDKSGDGQLDRKEIQDGLANPNINWELLGFDRDTYDKHIFQSADEDGDNRVSFEEFWNLVLRNVANIEEQKALAAAAMVSVVDISKWTEKDVARWVADIGLPQYSECFEVNGVHGYKLLQLTADWLPKLQVRQFDHIKYIMRELRILKGMEPEEVETLQDRYTKASYGSAKPIVPRGRTLRFGTATEFANEEHQIQQAYAKPEMAIGAMV